LEDRPSRARPTWTLNVAVAGWILIVLLVTVPGNPWKEASEERVVHAIPFEELFEELRDDDPAPLVVVAEMIGNLLLLFPLGILVPLRWPAMASAGRLLLGAGLLAMAVEAVQFGLEFGRRASATDVVLNTVGAGLGFVTLLVLRRLRRGHLGRSSLPSSHENG
jgi:glycopeptide antibiotics resistance protein